MNKEHNLTVGYDGTFKPEGKVNSTPTDINELIQKIKSKNKARLAIYFHGGLVGYDSGIESANGLNEAMNGDQVYPLSFIWKSGFVDTLKDNFTDIQKTKIFKKLLRYVVKKAGSKLGIEIGAKGTDRVTDADIDIELNKEIPFADFFPTEGAKSAAISELTNEKGVATEIEAELEVDFAVDTEFVDLLQNIDLNKNLFDAELIEEEEAGKGFIVLKKIIKALVKIIIRVIKRFINGRDHEPYATILEEILRQVYIADFGAWIWSGMKKKAFQMWKTNESLSGNGLHVGTYFLDSLNTAMAGKNLKIDLVGHSAGSIVICHLLENFSKRYPNLKIGKIAFMAPACRADLFHKEIATKPERFERFRMFTMTDEAELKDGLVNRFPKLYPSSLLYFVSGCLENEGKTADEPILGMERFIARDFYTGIYPFLVDVKAFLAKDKRLVLSPVTNQPNGFNSDALDHGDFDNNKATKASITAFLNPIHI